MSGDILKRPYDSSTAICLSYTLSEICLWKTPAHRTKDTLSGQAACSIVDAATEDRGGYLSTVCTLYRLHLKKRAVQASVVIGTQAGGYVYQGGMP